MTRKKYVWLNLSSGKFSNSWDEKTHKEVIDEKDIDYARKNNYKLIEYTCLSDDDFEFYNQMKLR